MSELIRVTVEDYAPKFVNEHPRIFAAIVGLAVPLFFLALWNWYSLWSESSKLEETIFLLSSEKEELASENVKLRQQLTPFLTTALEYYPGTDTNALSMLASRIEQIELTTLSLLDYQKVSKWDFEGNEHLAVGSGMRMSSGGSLYGWSKGYAQFGNDGLHGQIRCDTNAMDRYLDIINKEPLYPFPPYVVSECLKEIEDDDWAIYRERALNLVKKTSKIPAHHQHHDILLKLLYSGE